LKADDEWKRTNFTTSTQLIFFEVLSLINGYNIQLLNVFLAHVFLLWSPFSILIVFIWSFLLGFNISLRV